jgi:HK97 family phage prohead protease
MRTTRLERKVEYFPASGKQIKAIDDQLGIIAGHLNTFNNVDLGLDKTMPGAFRATIRDAMAQKAKTGAQFLWPLLWNHDVTLPPIGGISQAKEDSVGLWIEAKLNLEYELAKDVYSGFKFGSVRSLSMGYRTIESEYSKDAVTGKTIRELKVVDVVEGSVVNFPMDPHSMVSSVKGGYPMLTRIKDFDTRYASEQLDDWLYADFQDVTSALRAAIADCFSEAGDPLSNLENDVLPQLANALRAYVQQGVTLGYTPSSQDSYAMMSQGLDLALKSGYLSVAGHAKIKEASTMIQKHTKIIQSELANLESANARARAGQLAGWPVYGSASSSDYFEEKEEVSAALKQMTTSIEIENNLRELHDLTMETIEANSPSAQVDAALANLLASVNNKRR